MDKKKQMEQPVSLSIPAELSPWRGGPCPSLSWQVGEKWHYIAGDFVKKSKGHILKPAVYREQTHYGLNMVLHGRATCVDWRGQQHSLRAGAVYQRMEGYKHSLEIDPEEDWIEVYVSLRKRTVSHLIDLGLIHQCSVYHLRHPEVVLKQYTETIDTLRQANTAHVPSALIHIQNILMAIHENAEHENDRDQYGNQIADACVLLDCHLDQDLDMESIANTVGMAYETFRKTFKQRRGIAPGAYRVRKRLERSCILLRRTNSSINEIAESLGYSDGFTYSAQFKKIIGTSPSAYRSEK